MRYLVLLLLCSALVINGKINERQNNKNIVTKQRAALRSVKDKDKKQTTFTINNLPGDEKCVLGGGYCVSDEPLQCFGDVARTSGLCQGDRVCCSPKKCLTSRRFGICRPQGNCKLEEGEQAIAAICGPDTTNFECCLHPVFDVTVDTGKTIETQGCGVFLGANVFSYIGNSGPIEVVKIHREFLVDGTDYDKDPTEADNTLLVGAACAFGSLASSAELQGMTSPVMIPTPTPTSPSTPLSPSTPTPTPSSTPSEPSTPPSTPPLSTPAETPALIEEDPATPPTDSTTPVTPTNSNSLQLKVVRGFQTLIHQDFLFNCYQTKTCWTDKDPVPSYPGYSLFGNGNVVEIQATEEGLKWVADNIGYYGFRKTQFPNVYQWFPSFI